MAKRKSTKGQRSTKHTHKTKDRVTHANPINNRGGLMCSGRVSSSCYTGGTRRVTSFGLK